MLKLLLLSFLSSVPHILMAQHAINFRIDKLPPYHIQNNPVYITGTFNGWNPAQKEWQLKNERNHLSLTLSLPKGAHEYKFTRGGWDKVECADDGMPIENRSIVVISDTTVNMDVIHWADHFPKKPKNSTAGPNVKILDTAFYMPQLKRHRRIWIYLPESYAASRKRYPVLYMQDGQNLFDDATAFSGEWGVDEALDSLGKKYGETIVIGIDNGGTKRMNEYSPYDMERYGKGEGDQYVDFLVKTLRPYIHKKYRIKRWGKHHAIAGSSMGGLISFYALLKYPKKFGGAGVFSPAFWIVPKLKEIIPAKAKKVKGKIYFFAGMQEGEQTVPDMLQVFELMRKHSKAKITSVIRAEGKHNEATWRREFPLFYKWLKSGE